MTGKIKRRSLRCGGRPKADFGSLFTSVIAPALNTAGSIADESIDKHKTVIIPSDPTKTPTMRLGGRKKCWIGAAIGAATSIAGSLFGNGAKKREMRRQKSIQDWQTTTQEAANMSAALNNSQDYQEDYLRQFRTAARLGKTLGAKGIYITDGGDATKIDNNTYLLRGGSHEDVNETGQTGIGINVGGNEVEAEGGEVAQKKNGALRIFSAQPILNNGMSPAQAILRGYNKDKVFSQQQAFKKRNGLKDDGSKYQNGGDIDPYSNYSTVYKNKTSRGKRLSINKGIVYLNGKRAPKGYKWFDKSNRATYRVGNDGRFSIYQIHGQKPLERTDFSNDTYVGQANSRLELAKGSPNHPLFKADTQVWRDVLAKNNLEKKHIIPNYLPNVRQIKLNTKELQTNSKGKKFSSFKGVEIPVNLVDSIYKWTKEANQPLVNGFGLLGETSAGNIAPMSVDPNTRGYSNKVINNNGRNVSYIRPTELINNHQFWISPTASTINHLIRNGKVVDNMFEPGDNRIEYLPTDANYIEGDEKTYNEVNEALKYIKKDTSNPNPFIHALDYLKTGKYHIDKNYNNTVKERGKDFMSDKNVMNRINYLRKQHRLGGGLTSKDRGSSKHPYPSVSSKDFAGGGRSYPIPTKADAVDALRLAGLHGRSDVRSKVYSKYPSLRPKALGGMYVPFNKRYTSIYDAPDYDYDYDGGNALGDNEAVVTAKRIKPTFMKPNNDAMNLIKVPKEEEVPYMPQRHNRSRTIFSGGDYLGLGIDTLAALSTGLVNYNTAGKYVLPDRAPIIQASKLPTTYNVNPEIEEVKRYRDRLTGQTFNNTSSSVAALNRSSAINLDALSNLSKLWATKENEENKMLTEDAKNQQTVAAQNVQNELARQSEIARIKNEAIQAKGDALNVGLSGLSQAWTNFWTAGRTAYEDDQARRAMVASSKDATPTRLIEMGYDLSPDLVASLYRTAKDDRTKRFYLSRLSSAQRQRYGIN
jgi:hypothetical protein|nr:MAG TPA: hypothetical protein [Crassvirales sp.]